MADPSLLRPLFLFLFPQWMSTTGLLISPSSKSLWFLFPPTSLLISNLNDYWPVTAIVGGNKRHSDLEGLIEKPVAVSGHILWKYNKKQGLKWGRVLLCLFTCTRSWILFSSRSKPLRDDVKINTCFCKVLLVFN